jgi:predicted nucleotidyltransferase
MTSTAPENPQETLAELVTAIVAALPDDLLGLYLFGSLATGDFYEGRSDLDLIAVLASVVDERRLNELLVMHEEFEAMRPAWRDRIEVLYLSRDVLASFAGEPRGRVARISPGEPLHFRDLDGDLGWLLDWHAALSAKRSLHGRPATELGPDVPPERLRLAVLAQMKEMRETVRDRSVAYVPAHQGYIAATVCRGLYALEMGEQTSKEKAIAWVAERRPELADYLWSAYSAYRADVNEPHGRLMDFVESAMRELEN